MALNLESEKAEWNRTEYIYIFRHAKGVSHRKIKKHPSHSGEGAETGSIRQMGMGLRHKSEALVKEAVSYKNSYVYFK